MNKEGKSQIIDNLTDQVNKCSHLYLTDASGLNAKETSNLRRACFKENVQLVVVKNTLLKKAFERSNKKLDGLFETLKGSTSIMFTEKGNTPAKLIKQFRKGKEKPVLKGAFVEDDIYIGDKQLDSLISIKSKNELIADIISMLHAPIRNVISGLQNEDRGGVKETLSETE